MAIVGAMPRRNAMSLAVGAIQELPGRVGGSVSADGPPFVRLKIAGWGVNGDRRRTTLVSPSPQSSPIKGGEIKRMPFIPALPSGAFWLFHVNHQLFIIENKKILKFPGIPSKTEYIFLKSATL
mgnify:CR=1 FL=1